MSQLPSAPSAPAAWTGHRVPPQGRPAQLPPQRVAAYEPALPVSAHRSGPRSGPATLPTPDHTFGRPRLRSIDSPDALPVPRNNDDRPQHLIGLPRQPAPKQELIDVLEDVLRWSR